MKKIYSSVSEMVGKTPMFHFEKLEKKLGLAAKIYGKCEFYNPLFSIKDRAVKQMLGDIKNTADVLIIEATSGNAGVALAAMCAEKNIKFTAIMPEGTSIEKIKLIKYFGADVLLTPKEDGMEGAINKAEMLSQKGKEIVWLRQFSNKANLQAHLFNTGLEIWDDMEGNVDVLVASVGTSATLSGIAQALKTSNPELKIVAVEPQKSNVLSGGAKGMHNIPGIGAGFVPPFFDEKLVDRIEAIKDEDAWDMAKLIAQTEGLPIGISAGAAMVACVNLAQLEEMKDKNIVAVLPDAINNYVSKLK